ncbi:MAG TPA: response regulator [Puia sp.]|jgi:DNA-binding NarL/FixJ family response regulator
MEISVAIVDDNKVIRSLIEQIITSAGGYRLAGSFADAEEAVAKIPALHPDVVLMDINLGDGDSGIDCIRQLKPLHPEILFLVCTIYEEDEKIFEAFHAGATGYILKKTAPAKLLNAITEIFEGGAPMSNQIARKIANAFSHGSTESGKPNAGSSVRSVLSKREYEILELVSKGMLYKEISVRLFISPESVRKHMYHIYEKLHVNNRVEAVNKFHERMSQDPYVVLPPVPEKKHSFSREQMEKFFMLSISILKYVAHDLGNADLGINYALEKLKEEINRLPEGLDTSLINKRIDSISRSMSNIDSIYELITSHADSLAAGKKKESNFDQLFTSCPYDLVQLIRERNKNVEILTSTSPETLSIAYPRNILLSIFSELAGNAKKNTGSSLSLLFKWGMKENVFQCEIHDNGPGFEGLTVDLTPIMSIRRSEDGSAHGRGLIIIEQTIRDSGGDLFVSNSGILKGARVFFEFPVINFKL